MQEDDDDDDNNDNEGHDGLYLKSQMRDGKDRQLSKSICPIFSLVPVFKRAIVHVN